MQQRKHISIKKSQKLRLIILYDSRAKNLVPLDFSESFKYFYIVTVFFKFKKPGLSNRGNILPSVSGRPVLLPEGC